jgi:hypothetical protein
MSASAAFWQRSSSLLVWVLQQQSNPTLNVILFKNYWPHKINEARNLHGLHVSSLHGEVLRKLIRCVRPTRVLAKKKWRGKLLRFCGRLKGRSGHTTLKNTWVRRALGFLTKFCKEKSNNLYIYNHIAEIKPYFWIKTKGLAFLLLLSCPGAMSHYIFVFIALFFWDGF